MAAIKALTAMSPVFDAVSRGFPVSVTIETYRINCRRDLPGRPPGTAAEEELSCQTFPLTHLQY